MSRRFHLSIAVVDYEAAVADYSQRLGCPPCAEQPGRYALWRTELLNFTISCQPGNVAGVVRHVGFEDSAENDAREERDHAGLVWEYFTAEAQEKQVRERFPELVIRRGGDPAP